MQLSQLSAKAPPDRLDDMAKAIHLSLVLPIGARLDATTFFAPCPLSDFFFLTPAAGMDDANDDAGFLPIDSSEERLWKASSILDAS
jgi:hypothetical protein